MRGKKEQRKNHRVSGEQCVRQLTVLWLVSTWLEKITFLLHFESVEDAPATSNPGKYLWSRISQTATQSA